MTLRSTGLVLCAVVLLSSSPTVAQDDGSFLLSERSDEALRAYCEKVGRFGDSARDEGVTGAVILADTHFVDTHRSHTTFQANRVITRLDDLDEDVATQTIPIWSKDVEKAQAFVVRRDGSIERFDLDDDEIRVTEEDVDFGRSVVIGFPQVEPGDVFGYSVQTRLGFKLGRGRIEVGAEWPVRYGQLNLRSENRLAFNLLPQNMDADSYKVEVLEKDRTYPTLQRLTWVKQPGLPDETMTLPRGRRVPYVQIARFGDYDENWRVWFINDNWNWFAASFWSGVGGVDEIDGSVRSQAEAVAGAIADEAERADALHTWVQDEILLVEQYDAFGTGEAPASEQTLQRRAGTGIEKSLLLYDMMRAVGLPPVPTLLRASSAGALDPSAPGLWQFTHMAVVLAGVTPGGGNAWYCPGDPGSPPRSLPPDLRDVQALFVGRDPEVVFDRAIRRAYAETTTPEAWMKLVQRLLSASQIARFRQTPGDPGETAGRTTEVLQLGSDGATFDAQIESEGYTLMVTHEGNDLDEVARRWWNRRFPAHGIGSTTTTRDFGTPGRVVLRSTGEVPTDPLPPAGDDTWILDVASFFGETPLGAMDLDVRRSPLWIPRTEEFVFETWLPLPEGWTGARISGASTVRARSFGYSLGVMVHRGRLCVRREVRLVRGVYGPELFEREREAWVQAMDLESQALLVERVDRVDTGR